MGWIAYEGERFDEAIGKFQDALKSDPLSTFGMNANTGSGGPTSERRSFRGRLKNFNASSSSTRKALFSPRLS